MSGREPSARTMSLEEKVISKTYKGQFLSFLISGINCDGTQGLGVNDDFYFKVV